MSLVVAQVHDGQISLVADTKLTVLDDDYVTRHVFEYAFPKLLILRDDLCVGLAGNDPAGVAGDLIAVRHETVERVVGMAESMPYASFVIASLTPELRLIQVERGSIQDRTGLGRAWAGDEAAYSIFQQRWSEWPPGMETQFLLVSSLQWLLSSAVAPSVGGYLTHVASTSLGFRYVPQVTNLGPDLLNSVADFVDHDLKLRLSTPPGGHAAIHSHLCAVGVPPTSGALAYLLAPVGVSILFPHDEPHQPIVMRVQSMEELVDRAATEHGQSLAG